MKSNTKIRLHLSKKLFESLTREVIKENKNMSGGAYTEAVKAPKQAKEKKVEENKDKMEEMETKVAEKKGMSMDEMKKAHAKLGKKIQEMEANAPEKKMVKEFEVGSGSPGAKEAAETLMKAISSGDPFATGLVLVLAVVAGVVGASSIVPKLKGYWKALTGKMDENEGDSQAEELQDFAQEAGIKI